MQALHIVNKIRIVFVLFSTKATLRLDRTLVVSGRAHMRPKRFDFWVDKEEGLKSPVECRYEVRLEI